MTKQDIVDYLIKHTTLDRQRAIEAVDGVVKSISKSLVQGESVYIRGFATIKAVTLAQKKARDICRGTSVIIPERRSAKLILCKELAEKMNK